MNNNENIDKYEALEELLTKLQEAEKSVAKEGTISADDLEMELLGCKI